MHHGSRQRMTKNKDERPTSNIERPTSNERQTFNTEHSIAVSSSFSELIPSNDGFRRVNLPSAEPPDLLVFSHSTFDVGRSMFDVHLFLNLHCFVGTTDLTPVFTHIFSGVVTPRRVRPFLMTFLTASTR